MVTPHPHGVPGAHTPCLAAGEVGRDPPGTQHRGESFPGARLAVGVPEGGVVGGVGGAAFPSRLLPSRPRRQPPGQPGGPAGGVEGPPEARGEEPCRQVRAQAPGAPSLPRLWPGRAPGRHTAGASHRPATRRPVGTHGRAVCPWPVRVSCGSGSLRGQAMCPQAPGLGGVRRLQGGATSTLRSSLSQPGGPREGEHPRCIPPGLIWDPHSL